MYARALRDNPALQGKVVLELTIAPSGDITAARIVSSDLNDPEFESKLLARIRLFKFEAKDVATSDRHQTHRFLPGRMNIQSEIEFFSDLGLVDKARFIMRLIAEIAEEAKVGAGDGHDLAPPAIRRRDHSAAGALRLSAPERGRRASRRTTS